MKDRLMWSFFFLCGFIIFIPCSLEWIIRGRNTGMELIEKAGDEIFR
jgi:hypothetical protein